MNKPAKALATKVLDLTKLPRVEQTELEALADLAREVLGPKRRGPAKVVAVGRMKPTREQYREQTAQLRAELIALVGEFCERCGWPTPAALGHMHHTRGGSGRRRQEQSIENVAWLCGGCHDRLHRDNTRAREFREQLVAKRAPEARKAEATR